MQVLSILAFPHLKFSFSILFPYPALTVQVYACKREKERERETCVSVSISPWQHSSKTEPVRGLCLTSLFNQTQTHTSGQPGPRYLSLPPSARCTHPVLSLFCSLLLLFQHSSSASSSPPTQHPCASHCLPPALHLSPLPVPCSLCPLHPLLLPTLLLWAPLSLRDVTFSTDSGAAASKLGQNWLKMCICLVWCQCANMTVTYWFTPNHCKLNSNIFFLSISLQLCRELCVHVCLLSCIGFPL